MMFFQNHAKTKLGVDRVSVYSPNKNELSLVAKSRSQYCLATVFFFFFFWVKSAWLAALYSLLGIRS